MARKMMRTAGASRRVSDLEARIASGEADPITPSQRALAARIRVMHDQKRGVETEAWIKQLAEGAEAAS